MESCRNGGFVDNGAPGRVQEDGAVLHFRNGCGVDEILGFREQGAVEGNDVRLYKKGIQIHIAVAFPPGAAVGEDVHPQGFGNAANGLANFSVADDAHGHAGQLNLGSVPEAEVGAGGPFSFVNHTVVVADSVAQLQQQGDGELGHRSGAVGGDVAYGNAPGFGVGNVHHVVAGGQATNQLQIGAGVQDGFVDGDFVRRDEIRIANPLDGQIPIGCAVVNSQVTKLLQAVPAQVSGIQGGAVQYNDVHKQSPCIIRENLIGCKKKCEV